MRTKLALVSAVVGLFLLGRALPLSAHHAFAAEFDSNKPVKFEGTVTKMQWTNPHVWVYVDVKKPDGKVENWAFEAGTPHEVFPRGFSKNSLLPRTKGVVDRYQSEDRGHRANGRGDTPAPGTALFFAAPRARAAGQVFPRG